MGNSSEQNYGWPAGSAGIRWEEMAKGLMREIAFDSGMVNNQEDMMYPQEDVERLSWLSKNFFTGYPDLENPETINDICCGEYSENQATYGHLLGWEELQRGLNAYFNGEDDG
jgi:hypothetical protein